MNRKGFTLIELLAVIIILAILSLIVAPIVGNVIESARAATDLRSAESYVKAGENYFAAATLDTSKKAKLGTNVLDELEISGTKATGRLYVNADGTISMSILIRGKCYIKTASQGINEITIGDAEGCGGLPKAEIVETRIPEDSLYASEVEVTITVPSGMDGYIKLNKNMSILDGNISLSCEDDLITCEEVTISTLLSNTWYKIGSNSLKFTAQESIDFNIKISDGQDIEEQTYSVERIDGSTPTTPVISGGSDSWVTSSITISIETESTAISGIDKYQYYVSTSATEQTGGSWIDMDDLSKEISTNGEHYIYVKAISNAGKDSEISNAAPAKIDTGSVTAPVISGGSANVSSEPVTISVTTDSSAYSGILGYEYYVSTSETELVGGSWTAMTGKSVQISDGGLNYIFVRGKSNVGIYSEKSLPQTVNINVDPNPPVLNGLVPVVYDSGWVVVDPSTKWYDYKNKEWANAILLDKTLTSAQKTTASTVGHKLTDSEIGAMFVWIPRYEYSIPSSNIGRTDSNISAINIKFIPSTKTTADTGYKIHPGFDFGRAMSGFWVGKFELSINSSNSLSCGYGGGYGGIPAYFGCSQTLYIKPNILSASSTVGNLFVAGQDIDRQYGTSFDSHLAKYTEWTAVSYFTNSIYGRCSSATSCTEVSVNNSTGSYTGRSAGAPAGSSVSSSANGTYTYDQPQGQLASTTGNITGVYDMSGGLVEYVMGISLDDDYEIVVGNSQSGGKSTSGFEGKLSNGSTASGFSFPTDSKYYDTFKFWQSSYWDEETWEEIYTYNYGGFDTFNGSWSDFGGTMAELGSYDSLQTNLGWYGDSQRVVRRDYSWFTMGGYANDSSYPRAGIFNTDSWNGSSSVSAARIILPD